MAVAFDTFKAATRLQNEAGFNEKQARVLVATFAEDIGENSATKEDVAMLRSEMAGLRCQIEVLRGQMRELEQRMTVRIGALIAAAVGIIVALDKLL